MRVRTHLCPGYLKKCLDCICNEECINNEEYNYMAEKELFIILKERQDDYSISKVNI